MTPLRLPDFLNVVPGNTATLKIPHYQQTLIGLGLRLGGGLTKALIDQITLKLGTRPVWTCTGPDLDKIQKYKGIFDQATNIDIDFAERDFMNVVAREIGGYDMSVLTDDLYLEIKINAAAVAPLMLFAYGYFTPPQSKSDDPAQLVQKLVMLTVPIAYGGAGNKFAINWDPKGALVKRAYVNYGGADWGVGLNGNISKMDVRKNQYSVFEMECQDARFVQQKFRKVPQSKMFVLDFTVDNNLSGALPTDDAASLEWNTYPLAADTARIYFEVLDKPYNL